MTTNARAPRRLAMTAASAIAGLALLGGATFASWSGQSTSPADTLAAGNLDATRVPGTFTWSSDSEDGAGQGSGDSPASLAAHTMISGEVLTITQDFTTTLVGDNLTATLTASDTGAQLPTGTEADYDVTDESGTSILPGGDSLALGTASPAVLLDAGVRTWTVTVRIFDDPSVTVPAGTTATIGDLTLTLAQVKEG